MTINAGDKVRASNTSGQFTVKAVVEEKAWIAGRATVTKVKEEVVVDPETATGSGNAPPPPPVTIFGERNLPLVLISDIDHTIAFPDPAREFMDCESDIPNEKVIALIKAWYSLSENPTIYFVTNRGVGWRDVTVRWLIKQFSPGSYKWALRMRPSNDFYSSAASIKEGHLLDEIAKKYSVQQVWEDDPDCILMYRSHSLTVLDAKETWPSA